MHKPSRTAIAAALFLLGGVAWSQQHYKVDPGSSEVHFTLGASDGPVQGTFHLTSGDFTLDPSTGAMTGVVTVDAASGDSGKKSRDKKMANDELKAQTYATVTFAPAKFSGQLSAAGDSTGQVDGVFTLIGQAHTVSVPMTVHMEGDHFTATGEFTVPFVSWGMKDPSFLFMKVDKEAKVQLKLTGTVSR